MSGQGKCVELVAKAAEKNRYAKMVHDNMEACTLVETPKTTIVLALYHEPESLAPRVSIMKIVGNGFVKKAVDFSIKEAVQVAQGVLALATAYVKVSKEGEKPSK